MCLLGGGALSGALPCSSKARLTAATSTFFALRRNVSRFGFTSTCCSVSSLAPGCRARPCCVGARAPESDATNVSDPEMRWNDRSLATRFSTATSRKLVSKSQETSSSSAGARTELSARAEGCLDPPGALSLKRLRLSRAMCLRSVLSSRMFFGRICLRKASRESVVVYPDQSRNGET
eukprot:scaffold247_cov274-Pinguiococcus_pyrenoidosus.AAC.16